MFLYVFGGHASQIRGENWARLDNDIDLFCDEEGRLELYSNVDKVCSYTNSMFSIGFPERYVILGSKADDPNWKLIELEQVTSSFKNLLLNLPNTGSFDLFGINCIISTQTTDCLIKLAAIQAVPNCNPKHQDDLDEIGFDFDAVTNEVYLDFFNAWKSILVSRYANV